jgi:hypothetical protein
LVNEPCASYLFHTHPTARHSVGVGVDPRFQDLCEVMEELSDAAGRMVSNEDARREVQRLTRTYVLHRAIQELAFYRREGASLMDVVRHLWRWRALLARCTFSDFVRTPRLRLVGRILLPTPVIRLVRQVGIR